MVIGSLLVKKVHLVTKNSKNICETSDDANADDSDCEEVQLPEFDPEYESEDDEQTK